jgi:hypothetical protein
VSRCGAARVSHKARSTRSNDVINIHGRRGTVADPAPRSIGSAMILAPSSDVDQERPALDISAHRSVDVARRNRRNGNRLLDRLGANRLEIHREPGLRGAVGARAGEAADAGHRRDADDLSASLAANSSTAAIAPIRLVSIITRALYGSRHVIERRVSLARMTALEPRQLLIFERAYARMHATGAWPRLEALQRELASEHYDVSVRAVIMESAAYAGITSPNEEVRLLLRGLSAVPEARPLLEGYLRALQSMVERYRDTSVDARYTARDLDALKLTAGCEARCRPRPRCGRGVGHRRIRCRQTCRTALRLAS